MEYALERKPFPVKVTKVPPVVGPEIGSIEFNSGASVKVVDAVRSEESPVATKRNSSPRWLISMGNSRLLNFPPPSAVVFI